MSDQLVDKRRLPIFIHSSVDDMTELTPNAMRVYMHLARRASATGEAWPSYQSIGDHCFTSVSDNAATRKSFARRALDELLKAGLVEKESRKIDEEWSSNKYILVDPKSTQGGGVPIDTPVPIGTKGTTVKGTPTEGNGADAPTRSGSTDRETTPHEPVMQESLFVAEQLGEEESVPEPVSVANPPKNKRARKSTEPKLSDHPAVRAYHDLHERWPTKAQMKLIIERDPPLDNWVRALRAWVGRGYNPQNVVSVLDWADNPALMERRVTANGKVSYAVDETARWEDFPGLPDYMKQGV